MQNNQAFFESLFNRNFSDAGNANFLKEITAAHPYFSPAQFFLLQKTEAGAEDFEKQANRTNILFNNPYWLHFQIKQTRPDNSVADKIIEQITEEEEIPDNVSTTEVLEINTEPVNELPDDTEAAEEADMETEIEPMKIELKMPAEKTNLTEAMLFEPMHMVDYFASQGIKLTEEVQTADKLGKQLKSFTEWLKTMKKVHLENEAESNGHTDDNVLAMAENSNTSAEVLTESMAEVFVKQGKTGKATEVYQKLSLLNPAKSTYFAAKIENLKGL
ncbi:MAG: hypothetical protein WBP16_07600 [Ferruginibacter sp.]